MSRTIVVTGAASGIGKATAELLEKSGNRVIRVDLREGDVTADLSDPTAAIAEITGLTGGRLDGLVANAGVSHPTELSLKINYFGTVALIEGLRPLLAAGQDPRISVTSSAATLQDSDPELVEMLLDGAVDAALERGAALEIGYTNYSSSKRAISRWVRRVAPTAEYAGAGIGINAVGPGQVYTGMTTELFATEEGRRQAAEAMPTPYNGIAEAAHIAAVHEFLLSPANARMTGQVIFVDGGYDALSRGDDIW